MGMRRRRIRRWKEVNGNEEEEKKKRERRRRRWWKEVDEMAEEKMVEGGR